MITHQRLCADSSRSYDPLAEWLLFAQIVTATFLQKLALPLGGEQIYLGIPLMAGLTTIGLLTGRLQIQLPLLVTYCLVMALLLLTQLLGPNGFSLTSVLLLMVVHSSYLTVLKPHASRPGIGLDFFLKCMAILAALGIAQYALQFVIGDLAFVMETLFPQSFIKFGFHGLNPMGYGSHIYKSNGVFFLEPAVFCQFLAIAVIIELLYFRNWLRMALFMAAIAVTFSGTGLILLVLLLPVYLAANRQLPALALLLVAALSAGLWMPLVGLGPTYERIFEFTNPHSSGYARFISMFPTIGMYLVPEIDHFLLGMGAGSISTYVHPSKLGYEAFDPSWGKVMFEYGLIGLLGYLSLLGIIFWQGMRSKYLKAALLLQFLLLGEFVLAPTVHGLIVALLLWPSLNRGEAEKPLLATPKIPKVPAYA